MMKKMITIAAAALALSACGSDTPEVKDVSTPTSAYDHVEYAVMDTVWDMQTLEGQHLMCGVWVQTPGIVVSEMSDAASEATVRAFFADKCE